MASDVSSTQEATQEEATQNLGDYSVILTEPTPHMLIKHAYHRLSDDEAHKRAIAYKLPRGLETYTSNLDLSKPVEEQKVDAVTFNTKQGIDHMLAYQMILKNNDLLKMVLYGKSVATWIIVDTTGEYNDLQSFSRMEDHVMKQKLYEGSLILYTGPTCLGQEAGTLHNNLYSMVMLYDTPYRHSYTPFKGKPSLAGEIRLRIENNHLHLDMNLLSGTYMLNPFGGIPNAEKPALIDLLHKRLTHFVELILAVYPIDPSLYTIHMHHVTDRGDTLIKMPFRAPRADNYCNRMLSSLKQVTPAKKQYIDRATEYDDIRASEDVLQIKYSRDPTHHALISMYWDNFFKTADTFLQKTELSSIRPFFATIYEKHGRSLPHIIKHRNYTHRKRSSRSRSPRRSRSRSRSRSHSRSRSRSRSRSSRRSHSRSRSGSNKTRNRSRASGGRRNKTQKKWKRRTTQMKRRAH